MNSQIGQKHELVQCDRCMLHNTAILLCLVYKALLITHVKHLIRLRRLLFVMPLVIAKHELYI